MSPAPPGATRTDTPCPYPPLCRSERRECRQQSLPCLWGQSAGRFLRGDEVHGLADHDRGDHARPGVGRTANPVDAGRCERDRARLVEAELDLRSEEHTSELQSLMRISYAVFCLKKKKT